MYIDIKGCKIRIRPLKGVLVWLGGYVYIWLPPVISIIKASKFGQQTWYEMPKKKTLFSSQSILLVSVETDPLWYTDERGSHLIKLVLWISMMMDNGAFNTSPSHISGCSGNQHGYFITWLLINFGAPTECTPYFPRKLGSSRHSQGDIESATRQWENTRC